MPRRHPGRRPTRAGRLPHARKTVTTEVDDTTLRVLDEREKILKVVSRTTTDEATRLKAYGHRSYQQA
jgi:hypothetical protein